MSKDILIVDDEAAIREIVGAILEDEGYRRKIFLPQIVTSKMRDRSLFPRSNHPR